MADWTLVAIDTPLAGSGQRAELSMASGRNMRFSLNAASTLSFTLPGRHWQTTLVEPLTTDILVYRDSYCIQRFRVTAMSISKSGADMRCSFTAVSYRELLNAWVFHTEHTRRFIAVEQTAIAWTIISESEAMEDSDFALTRGTLPTTPVNRTLDGDWDDTGPIDPYFYKVGVRKGDSIDDLSLYDNGFEFDIEPDRTSAATEYSSLKFNTWNFQGRKQYSPRCPLVLDDGGNVAAWSRNTAPTEYANVIHAVGQYPEGIATADDPPPETWSPISEDPGGTPPEGRWERSVSVDSPSMAALTLAADAELERALAYQPAWSVDLAAGRWNGPTEMWVGDYCRLVVNDGPVDVDADARVVSINLTVDDNGLENIKLDLDRPARSYNEFRADLEKRLLNLEHR